MSSETAIRVANLSKCYQIYAHPRDRLLQGLLRGRRQLYREFWALRDLSFEVGRGETVAIIGRNGSGKSTLLQLIAGTLAATSGSIEMNGRVAALLELGSGFNPEFSGRENVFLNAALLGLGPAETERRFDDIAAFADIGDFIDQPVKTYSSGMLVRLAFAVSINVEPDILIVDEALSVGDAAFQFKCLERMDRLSQSGTTLLFVSHDMGMVKTFCHRALYLEAGALVSAGPTDQVIDRYLLDIHNQRQRAGAVRAKESAGGSGARLSFGTERGAVLGARFADTGAAEAAVLSGATVRVCVDVAWRDDVRHPCVSMLIQDRKLITLAGRIHRIEPGGTDDEARRASVEFAFPARFASGHYFISFRLEERAGGGAFVLVDKQNALLALAVTSADRTAFLGLMALDIESTELPPAGQAPDAGAAQTPT